MPKMETIADYKEKYRQLTSMLEREQFLLETREKYKDFASPAMKKFLNNRIKEFNDEVARTNYYASLSFRELRRVFDSFTTVPEMRQFILDIKGIYGDSRNYELRKLLNRCVKKHNTLLEESGIFEDSQEGYDVMHEGYPEYMEHEEYAQNDQLLQKEHHAEVEKFPAFVNDAEEFLKNADYLGPAGGAPNSPVGAAHADYVQQAAKAVQAAHAENPEFFGINDEGPPLRR